jgi:CheY-like chemotaxis protein
VARILIADDHRANRDALAALLETGGHEVLSAAEGSKALELARSHHPELVITDVLMPIMDGYELTRRLKGDPRTSAIPVVAITGYAPFTQDPSRADRAGCDAILPKPCDPDDLTSTLRALIAEARGRRTA